MTEPRVAPTIMSSAALMRSDSGPAQPNRYRIPLDLGALFRWIVGSDAADDSWNYIVPTGGGTLGAWERVVVDDRGANLTDANATIQIGDLPWRVLPAATLTANRTITLGTTGALAGDRIEITRLGTEAFTLTIANGGDAGGNVATLPISQASFVVAQFNGTDWALRRSAALL